jgi:glucosamine--fructose-6-phosphate aminotransferase (isomerizing)
MSLLEQEIGEQPEVAARLLDAVLPRLGELHDLLRSRGAEQVLLVARGSSDNAARYAQYLWQLRARTTVTLATPSLSTVYDAPPDLRRHAVVAVSQSGRSPDVVAVVEQARAAGRPTLVVTNDPASPLAQAAEDVLDLGAGPERSVAATKTYTSSVLAMALLGCALHSGTGSEDLRAVPDALDAAIGSTEGVEAAAALLAAHSRGVCVGRGLNLATAHETALKVTELTGALVAPYSPADLMHGPVAAVGPQTPVLMVAPAEAGSASVLEAVPELRRRAAPVVVVSDRVVEDTVPVTLPDGAAVADWLTPVTAVVPGQLLAWRAAELRGIDVDHPGELSKVTLTR